MDKEIRNNLLCVLTATAMSATALGGVSFPDIHEARVTGGFWLPRTETNRLVTLGYDLAKCETTGRTGNFSNAAVRAWGKFLTRNGWDDSDVFKVVEGAAYVLATDYDPKLDAEIDRLIDLFARAQERDGYLYTARTLGANLGMAGKARWEKVIGSHELYNMGHLIEAGVAHNQATGKTNLLNVAIKAADLIDRTFGPGPTQLHDPAGHPEIELALVKLAGLTGERRYFEKAKYFTSRYGMWLPDLKRRGVGKTLTSAADHAVRGVYLYSSMSDYAYDGDAEWKKTDDALWNDVVGTKLHITGGVGALADGERFGCAYQLPNDTAYLETCAAIGNALWNARRWRNDPKADCADVFERIIYNGFLSGISMDGKHFFYGNPTGSPGSYVRSEWFGCSCCPVNVVRFIPQIVRFAYAADKDDLYWNLFLGSEAKLLIAGGTAKVVQATDYPASGASKLTFAALEGVSRFTLRVRIPGWARGRNVPSDLYSQLNPSKASDVRISVNGAAVGLDLENGYAKISRDWKAGDTVEIAFPMEVRRVKANDAVVDDRGRIVFERGPVVYCAEGADNGGRVRNRVVAADAPATERALRIGDRTVVALEVPAAVVEKGVKRHRVSEPTDLTLIPYWAWAHRGAGEMVTWLPTRPELLDGSAFKWKSSQGDKINPRNTLHCNDDSFPRDSGNWFFSRIAFEQKKHFGTEQWVEFEFPEEETLSSVGVYWYDDEYYNGNRTEGRWKGRVARVPAHWTVQTKDAPDGVWRDVPAKAYPVLRDRLNFAEFTEPLKTRHLRVFMKLQDGRGGGIMKMEMK